MAVKGADTSAKSPLPSWLMDAKFGIYTHWGPVTVGAEDGPGGVQWYGRNMYVEKSPTFAYHRDKYGDQHQVGYKDMVPKFRPEKFDAEAWAELFAASGARFAGPVVIHHDDLHPLAARVFYRLQIAGPAIHHDQQRASPCREIVHNPQAQTVSTREAISHG